MKVLVTGGGGFLGRAIVKRLRARGEEVRSISRGDYPALREMGVHTLRGDLADAAAISEAVRGCDAVLHVAGLAGMWGRRTDYFEVNVRGTRHVLAACREHGVGRLVYTSSPSVIQRRTAIEGADESIPYPERHDTHYQETKAIAEREVLAATGDDLLTVALRPRMIWGPGDTQLGPRLIARRRAGRLRLVGDGRALVDSTYIDNAAAAHLLALDRLAPGAACAGRAYFLTNGEPWPIGELMNAVLRAAGEEPVTARVSPGVAAAAGAVCEWIWGTLRLRREPPMTRFFAAQLSTANWFDIGAARRDLGYEPTVSMEEGLARLAAWYREHPP